MWRRSGIYERPGREQDQVIVLKGKLKLRRQKTPIQQKGKRQ